jgi:hypothetical protein
MGSVTIGTQEANDGEAGEECMRICEINGCENEAIHRMDLNYPEMSKDVCSYHAVVVAAEDLRPEDTQRAIREAGKK